MAKYSGLWTLSQQAQATGTNQWPRKPGAPTIGTATAGTGNAFVTFTAPTDAGVPAIITSYTATSNPGGITGSASASPITVTGLTNGQAYTFTVTATNATGTGPASAASNSVTPVAGKTVQIKVWGAGGGAGGYSSNDFEYGGPGGYSEATFTVSGGTVLSIYVGQAGGNYQTGGDPNGGNGFQGAGNAGKGGGFCGVFVGSYTWANLTAASIPSSSALIIAGSGGGGSYYGQAWGGGYGGGTSGSTGINRFQGSSGSNTDSGAGGTDTSGGAGGSGPDGNGANGSLYKGGSNSGSYSAPGGGGGAGWYGGGGAGARNSSASSSGGGGGGSGMIASITSGTSLPSGVSSVTGNQFVTQTGTGVTAPNNSDSDYVAGRGVGANTFAGSGGNGLIVIYIDGVKTSYSYTGNVQTVTV